MSNQNDDLDNGGKTLLITFGLVALLALAAGAFLMLDSKPAPVAEQLPIAPPVKSVEAEPAVERVEEEPVVNRAPEPELEQEVEESPRRALPKLNDSDSTTLTWFAELSPSADWAQWWIPKELIRKIVLQVDNVRQGKYARKYTPFKPPVARFSPVAEADRFHLSEASYQRYDAIVSAVVSVGVSNAHELYLDVLPLLQQAQQELGYRESQTFERSLLSAINHLLNAPVLDYFPELHRPGVLYQFKDESLENLPATYKLLLRMGPANTQKIKTYLSAFKAKIQSD